MSFTGKVQNVHAAHGRAADCALIDWIAAQAGRDEDQVRQEMIQRPDWSPRFAAHALVDVLNLYPNDPGKRAQLHLFYAQNVATANKSVKWRGLVGAILRDHGSQIAEPAKAILQSWLR